LGREATPDLLLPLKRRRFRRPSPQRRVAAPFRQWLIGLAYRPSDGVGHHRSWHGTIVSRRQRVAPAWSASGIPQHRGWGERFGLSSALHPRAVTGAPSRPKTPSPEVTLPGPYVTPPPPEPPVATRWLLSSPEIGEFEQGVLHGCGPAQVGFGDRLSSFHRLTVSSRGKLSPEPLRLTRPEGARTDLPRATPWELGVDPRPSPVRAKQTRSFPREPSGTAIPWRLPLRELWRPFRACPRPNFVVPGCCPGLICCGPFGASSA
jgi:hypothetical protein